MPSPDATRDLPELATYSYRRSGASHHEVAPAGDRRAGYHVKRLTGGLDPSFFLRLACGLLGFVLAAALLVAIAEGPRDNVPGFFGKLGKSSYWAVTMVMESGDSSYVSSPAGYVVSWLLILFGVANVATVAAITGALVGFVIDYLLKEGQGMGAA